jgi:hypothetical protein
MGLVLIIVLFFVLGGAGYYGYRGTTMAGVASACSAPS